VSIVNRQDRPSYTNATKTRVECLRALHPAMSAVRAATALNLDADVVTAVWDDQDAAAGIDNAVDMYVPNPGQKRHHFCRSGQHALSDDNIYQRPNGDRECAACRTARKHRDDAMRAGRRVA